MLGSREALILQTLMELPKDVVLIGGYAVNAYVPPMFSIDCDLVVFEGVAEIKKTLVKNGFEETEKGDVPYGEYFRFVRKKEKVSFDLLLNSVFDRVSGIVFEGSLFKKYSKERVTVGRANPIRIRIRIADAELLFAMKFVSARRQDIRDIFMLSGTELNRNLIRDIIKEKCSEKLLKKRVKMIKAKVANESYRDSLHGAFGKIPDKTFDRCISNLVRFLNGLASI
ncbi:MAG: hypothetical protein QMD13_00105 [Candidatus Bathyarchaeia archaeon]|nr:hypothetical protein [Candidatus Bathyarchaeia archaeon]